MSDAGAINHLDRSEDLSRRQEDDRQVEDVCIYGDELSPALDETQLLL